jgi:diaminohydroxyphosphoribosylaminopyrimidine deaminase/5-amino-6-(5-phosphoribosylamino)uracil reductase
VDAGADVSVLDRDPTGGVSIAGVAELLGKRDVQGVLLEGGPTIAWSAIRDGVVDQVVVYVAPKLIGGHAATGWLGGGGFAPIGRAAPVDLVSVETLGRDLKVVADVHRDR